MNIVIKGIGVDADAAGAVQYGADAIWVSNHGGRATETGLGTIECLPEIVSAVNGRTPIIVDGCFRLGTAIYKALAMGASAVGIGRPNCFGLGALGKGGVKGLGELLHK